MAPCQKDTMIKATYFSWVVFLNIINKLIPWYSFDIKYIIFKNVQKLKFFTKKQKRNVEEIKKTF
jgi:hypothetical protein